MCPEEAPEAKRARALAILRVLKGLYPKAQTELSHRNPYELLVATVLSAQATDKSVNQATPALFARFPNFYALAQATPEEVEPYIRKIGLYRTKAKNLVALARRIVEEYGGEIPRDKEALLRLPGVGWKTATVFLGAAFGVPGIGVDTHVARLAHRLCLSQAKAPERIGRDLEARFPQEDWVFVHHALVLHGRYVCTARKPNCRGCGLRVYCPGRKA